MSQPVFYYDLTDPFSYLAAERITAALSVVAEWEPVWAGALDLRVGAIGDGVDLGELDRHRIAARAQELGLQPLRWPPRHDGGGHAAALAATYAKQVGRVVGFSFAAFRQAFAGGHDLDQESTVLLAGAACELHPRALLQALTRPAIATALAQACDRARRAGVTELPAVQLGDSVFTGDQAVEQAAAVISVARR